MGQHAQPRMTRFAFGPTGETHATHTQCNPEARYLDDTILR